MDGRHGGALGLLRACHPAPALAVTLVVTALAWRSGWQGLPLAVLGLAMLSGQLSVGWSNDAHDARTDLAAQRRDKPVVVAGLSTALLWRCALAALALSVLASFAAAGAAGAFHVAGLVAAWAYNLWLSRTPWSWLPYAVAFGLLPPFITCGLEPPQAPAAWAVLVFVAVGVAAHLANAARDADIDAAHGHGGAAVSLGPRRTRLLALALLLVGTAILAWQLWGASPLPAVLVAAASLAVAAVGVARPRALFPAILALALIDVGLLLAAGVSIVS